MNRLAPVFALLVLTGCSPVGFLYVPDDTDGVSDSGDSDSNDTDSGIDTSATDTGETQKPPENPLLLWEGTRRFYYSSDWWECDATVTENGNRVEPADADYATLLSFCPDCTAFYHISVAPEQICDYVTMGTDTYRGLMLREGSADVYRMDYYDDEWSGYLMAEGATWSGKVLDYFYNAEVSGADFDVTGQVNFPWPKD